ncbi:MAG: TIGR00701 family protein [Rickettsiales bacterium]|nr:TIGR00701 family protein [Rickettsiales bacterium]
MYAWVLALHIISIIAWMAGLLYLPRLFVYHVDAVVGSELSETLKIMERRLFHAIMMPAMIASWFFGLWIAVKTDAYLEVWFHIKLALVVFLSASHLMMGKWRKDFALDQNIRSARFYRFANEVPTLLMVGIVILVIVKPF